MRKVVVRFASQRRLPALERQLPDGNVLARPDAGERGADVDTAESPANLVENLLHLGLVGQVAADDHVTTHGLGPLAPAVVVDGDPRAFLAERTHTSGADSARAARDEHALVLQTGLHR